jgi:hypothetical protein
MWTFRASAAAFAAVALSAAAAAQDGIAVQELEDVDPLARPVLSRAAGALPPSLWTNSDLTTAADAVRRAARDGGSLSAAELTARVLLSGGQPPARAGDSDSAEDLRDLALARVGGVNALARISATGELVPVGSRLADDPDFAEQGARAKLALGDAGGACRYLEDLQSGRQEAFWLKLRAACFALAGEAAAAETTIELARDAGAENVDADFAALVARAAGGTALTDPVQPRDGVEAALAITAGLPISSEAVNDLEPDAAAGLAVNERASGIARAAAARRAARVGALRTDQIAAAYGAAAVTESGVDILAAANAAEGPLQTALFHQAVLTVEDPYARAEALAAALAMSETTPDFIVAARLYASEIAFLPREGETLANSEAYIAALAAAGETGTARAWLQARRGAPGASIPVPGESSAAVEAGAIETSALEVLVAASDPAATPAQLAAAAEARLDAAAGAPEAERLAAAADVTLLLALGAEPRPRLRAAAADAAAGGPALPGEARAARYALDAAIAAEALADAALNAAGLVDAAGMSDPHAVAEAVRALRLAGLERDARAFVIESLIALRRGS